MSDTGTPRTSDGATAFADGCAHCGSPFTNGEWYPVVTDAVGGDGPPSVYSFCDDDCRAAWSAGD